MFTTIMQTCLGQLLALCKNWSTLSIIQTYFDAAEARTEETGPTGAACGHLRKQHERCEYLCSDARLPLLDIPHPLATQHPATVGFKKIPLEKGFNRSYEVFISFYCFPVGVFLRFHIFSPWGG